MTKANRKTRENSGLREPAKTASTRRDTKVPGGGRLDFLPGEKKFFDKKERIAQLGKQGFSRGEIHELVAPPRTLGRRKETLNLEESDRVQRLERVIEHATRVFGSLDKANAWLRTKNRALDGEMPISLLVSETGAHEVKMQLHAIDYGMYA